MRGEDEDNDADQGKDKEENRGMDEYEGDDEKEGENEDKSKDKTEDGDAHVQVLGYDGKIAMAFTYTKEIAQWKGKVKIS